MIGLAIGLVALVAAAGAVGSRGADRGFSPAEVAAIDATVIDTMATQNVPGVNVAVFAPGKRFERSYGISDIATDEPMDPADTIRMASISKTFTAVAVLRLVDRGRLRLNEKLADYVKGVPRGGQISIRQLLAMTGGIYDFTRDDQFNAAFSANPLYPGWEPRDTLEILDRHEPDFRPGKMVSYSDSNYILLGFILEKITGKPVEDVIDRLAQRAGLRRTLSPTTAELESPFAHGYYGGDEGDQPLADYTLVNPDVAWTAGNMTTTIGDLKIWAKALGTGELISRRLFRKQIGFRPIANPGGPSIGYGLGMFRLDDWIGHNGAIYGFNTSMFYLPAEKATILISANKSTNFSGETIGMFFALAGELFPGSVTTG